MIRTIPAEVDYAVKRQLQADVYHAGQYLCSVTGYALSYPDCGRLQSVVLETEDGVWIELQHDEVGGMELFAKALWGVATTDTVRNDLEFKWDAYEIEREFRAQDVAYERMIETARFEQELRSY
jgi:hypothetical protein